MASEDVFSFSFEEFNPIHVNPKKHVSRKRKLSVCSDSSEAISQTSTITTTFDPSKHLAFTPPSKIWTMEEIGLANKGVSPNAVSEPFSLFTADAVAQMRAEVLSREVMDNCRYSSNLIPNQLRGFAADYAPFVYDAWRSPEILSIISKIAGVELVPSMDFEIAHVNLSTSSEEEKDAMIKALAEKAHRDADEGVAGCPYEGDDTPSVDWHTDSYPFVCVTMLSDCTNMIGGETALRKGNGEVMKVRGPGMGYAVILQGRYIEHQALRALGTTERISMVTSFRPKSAFVKDDTVLTTVRGVSDLSKLYAQYSEYRLEMLEERVRAHEKEIRQSRLANRTFNTAATKSFITEEIAFLTAMLHELVDEDKVVKGYIDGDTHLLSDDLKHQSKKRARLMSEES